ncbi:hypothetical protein TNCV_4915461 [Trichonephila clavipes]|nr:hypothetical protein TNCV_4915461 [Trichonephila clavipes]
MRLINHELGYSVLLFQKSSFQFLESLFWGGWRPATSLSRASQMCSIGLMSGVIPLVIPFVRFLPRKGNPPPD